MIKIAITGICGRMGSSIYNCLFEDDAKKDGLILSCATSLPSDKNIGEKVKDILGQNSEVIITDKLNSDFDILIDFTSIKSTFSNLEFCKKHNKAIVIGTTGFSEQEITKVNEFAQNIPVFMSFNMSLGVNVMQRLVALATKNLYQKSDVEIVETHHKHKVDAPSGTAMMLGNTVADAANINLSEKGVFSRHGIIGEREAGEIGFSTIRGGDVVGEHTVSFYMAGERVEITHKATDRKIFARGALFAAKFMSENKAGFYNMNDALSK